MGLGGSKHPLPFPHFCSRIGAAKRRAAAGQNSSSGWERGLRDGVRAHRGDAGVQGREGSRSRSRSRVGGASCHFLVLGKPSIAVAGSLPVLR